MLREALELTATDIAGTAVLDANCRSANHEPEGMSWQMIPASAEQE